MGICNLVEVDHPFLSSLALRMKTNALGAQCAVLSQMTVNLMLYTQFTAGMELGIIHFP